MTMEEKWKPIPGFEGLYEASTLGRVRSSPGRITSSDRFPERHWKTRIMKTRHLPSKKRQDERISLYKDGVYHYFLLSRLIAMTFLGQPEEKMTVNHIDGDYTNNRVDNLEWLTREENIRRGFTDGLYGSIQKPITLLSQDGESFPFKSLSEASRGLGRYSKYLSYSLARGKTSVYDKYGNEYKIV